MNLTKKRKYFFLALFIVFLIFQVVSAECEAVESFLAWEPSMEGGEPTGYIIYYTTDEEKLSEICKKDNDDIDSHHVNVGNVITYPLMDLNLHSGTHYIAVKAYIDGVADSDCSNVVVVEIDSYTPPDDDIPIVILLPDAVTSLQVIINPN